MEERPTAASRPSLAAPSEERRPSVPMMAPFMTSAPGKVIMFGEHAVVYSRAAMAAAISLRSYLLVTTLSRTKRTVTLRFPDIGLDHTWRIDELPWTIFSRPDKKKTYYDVVTSLDPDLVQALQPLLSNVTPEASSDTRRMHHAAASSFLYLFLSLGSQDFPGCIYTLRSTLPIGAGLGSSASISVCISAALLLQIYALSGPHPDQPVEESQLQVQRINHWAFVAELCIHGNPSGVDNTVAAGGRAVLFRRQRYGEPPTVQQIQSFPELSFLLTNTRQSRSTATEVAKVAALKKSQPDLTELVLETIDRTTTTAVGMAAEKDFAASDESSLARLGELINLNHGLLAALGVSHPKLERIRELVDVHGVGWTKLTGAGGGGCAITLLKPAVTSAQLQSLETDLQKEDFERFETTLGGPGVGVLCPAVVNFSGGSANGEEIDQEKFLQARGREGVEQLVGAANGRGWRYWA